jgi:hypothetical protein
MGFLSASYGRSDTTLAALAVLLQHRENQRAEMNGGQQMPGYRLLAAAIVLAGCSTLHENQSLGSESQLVQQNPRMLKCRMGSTMVCKTSGAGNQKKWQDCRCTQTPYSLNGARNFRVRQRGP